MPARLLVTGATGRVGGAVARALLPDAARGAVDLLAGARSAEGRARLGQQGITAIDCDYDRPETLRPALEGVTAVFLATGYSVDMVAQSKRLLDAARAEGVRHVVHLGAHAPEDAPQAHFAWHQIVERAIEGMGFAFTHLHPNYFMDTVWDGFRRRPDRLTHFVADRTVSWVAADDIAAVAAQVLRAPEAHAGQRLVLAAEALSFPGLAALLSDVTGRQVTYDARPADSLLALLLKQGMEAHYARGLAAGVVATEAGQMPGCADVSDAIRQVTGRAPISWRDFAAARLAEPG